MGDCGASESEDPPTLGLLTGLLLKYEFRFNFCLFINCLFFV